MSRATSLLGFGAEDDDEEQFKCDPHRHCPPEGECGHDKADADWSRTLAALDGVAGDSIYDRAELDDAFAYWDDWRRPE